MNKVFCLIIFFLTRTGLSLTWLLSASIKIFVIYKLFIYFYSLHLRRSCFVHELLSRIVLVWFLCIFFFNFLAHFIKIFDDLSPLLYVFKSFIPQKLLFMNKVECAFPVVVVCLLPHAEFGRNDHREDTPHFRICHFLGIHSKKPSMV